MTADFLRSKKRLILPWSLQASHQRKLEKEGKKYKFGSYKYTAQTLYDRGILLSIDQFSPRQFDKISLTISSDEVGMFEISASSMGISMVTVELKLEELLEMQFVSWCSCGARSDADAFSVGWQADDLDWRGGQGEPQPHRQPHQPQVLRLGRGGRSEVVGRSEGGEEGQFQLSRPWLLFCSLHSPFGRVLYAALTYHILAILLARRRRRSFKSIVESCEVRAAPPALSAFHLMVFPPFLRLQPAGFS